MGAELITVSCDTHFTHLAWHTVEKELKDVKFKMGSDKTGELARQFGIYLDGDGLALRGTYVIAPDGKTAFVADYGIPQRPGKTLTIVDLVRLEVKGTVDLGRHRRPHGLFLCADGTLLVSMWFQRYPQEREKVMPPKEALRRCR